MLTTMLELSEASAPSTTMAEFATRAGSLAVDAVDAVERGDGRRASSGGVEG